MSQEFDEPSRTHINRDEQGTVRDVLHLEGPFRTSAPTAQLAAQEYLRAHQALLGLSEAELGSLALEPEPRPIGVGPQLRFSSEKAQFDTTTVTYAQTCLALPVWEAGVSVQMRRDPLQVVSAQSTAHRDIGDVPLPASTSIDRLLGLSVAGFSRSLGLSATDERFDRKSLEIERRDLYIYRYEADMRTREPDDFRESGEVKLVYSKPYVNPDLPSVPAEIVSGRHYVVSAMYFALGTPAVPQLRWVALVEVETTAVLMLRALAASVSGLVFLQDPITLYGGPPTNAPDTSLNPLRQTVTLRPIDPPAGGNYGLTGSIVAIKDVEPPTIAPPVEPVGTDFDFNARTDDFAAVNAFHHANRFFEVMKEFGFDLSVYFGGTVFPTTVDHRGLGPPGNVINAHCLGNGAYGILQTTFALADLTNLAQPLGIACDYRVVLHELAGHGTLYNQVNGPNFGFAHSAGDSVGVVLNDFDSVAPDRFMSFPWLYFAVQRRHDRTPASGWGWAGNIALHPFSAVDAGGYNNEQILCTTHFRIYRAIGGDSTERRVREFAGRYVAYLILRTIGALTAPTNPPNALVYASDLITAEAGNWVSAGQVGGCYWKVIRWAFEKQGLYQPAATPKPNNLEGPPPPVDVYIDDGRHGEYTYVPGNTYYALQKFWENNDIWNRHHPDGHLRHEAPLVGVPNYAYVRVKNRGTNAAGTITVRGWHCRPSAGLVWPDDWAPMATASRTVPALAPGNSVVVGPFEWLPVERDEPMLMGVSTSGDLANNDPAAGLPAATGPTPVWRLVPCDNNLGLRARFPVPGGGHRDALARAFEQKEFWASNPFTHACRMAVRVELPAFLANRGWGSRLANPGGGSFTLGPRDSRVVRPRLVSGQDFTALDVKAAGSVAIEIIVLADDLVVGGLTYFVDAEMTAFPEALDQPHGEHGHEEHHVTGEYRDDEPRREPDLPNVRVDVTYR